MEPLDPSLFFGFVAKPTGPRPAVLQCPGKSYPSRAPSKYKAVSFFREKSQAQKKKILIALLLPLLVVGCNTKKDGEETPHGAPIPNIVYINVDDLGWMDTGAYGSTFYETPNIDALAKMGMTFTNGYASAANCAPSRACLMSGQHTPRHGIYTVANSDRGDGRTRKLIPIPNTELLADSLITIAEMLKREGYKTGIFGKWHLGKDPRTQGFDINVGGSHRGNPGPDGYFAPYNLHDLQEAPQGENLTDRLTLEAIKFMQGAQGQPFFAYLPYYAVHTPLATSSTLEEKYLDKRGNARQNNAKYAGMIETVDKNVGLLLNYLKASGHLKNTLIIFTSDNGAIRDISRQNPLRAGKGSYYEGGIRVPFIFSWEGRIAADTHNSVPITNLDIFPTLMELAESDLPAKVLDGNSLTPLFKGNTIAERDLFFHFPIYLQAYNTQTDEGRDSLFRTRPGTVLISGKWKLHHYFEDNGYELYDLGNDLGEQNNLAETHKERVVELGERMNAWRAHLSAPIPRETNPDYDPNYR